MKPVSTSACALMLAVVFFAAGADRVSALPMRAIAAATDELLIPAACKYGSGKCADVKPVHAAPSTEKHGPQDPTVDPDCGHYGNCRGGNPEGNSASAKRDPTTQGLVKIDGIKGESKDKDHGTWSSAPAPNPTKPTITAASQANSLKPKNSVARDR